MSPDSSLPSAPTTHLHPCAKGHAKLVWTSTKPRYLWNINSQPMEMLAASGFLSLAAKVGRCPRCHQDVEWSSE